MIKFEVDEITLASYEKRQLLYKDLCSRIPYKVKVKPFLVTTDKVIEIPKVNNLTASNMETIGEWAKGGVLRYIYIPFLFPMSSITEEQKDELVQRKLGYYHSFDNSGKMFFFELGYEVYDWLNKHHFDYRGLIEKGLAIDATTKPDVYK